MELILIHPQTDDYEYPLYTVLLVNIMHIYIYMNIHFMDINIVIHQLTMNIHYIIGML